MSLCLRVIKVSHKVKTQTPLYFQELPFKSICYIFTGQQNKDLLS